MGSANSIVTYDRPWTSRGVRRTQNKPVISIVIVKVTTTSSSANLIRLLELKIVTHPTMASPSRWKNSKNYAIRCTTMNTMKTSWTRCALAKAIPSASQRLLSRRTSSRRKTLPVNNTLTLRFNPSASHPPPRARAARVAVAETKLVLWLLLRI